MINNFKVYDKVSWHYPEGNNCPSLEAAKKHFKIIMEWLYKHNLLSEEGKEIYEAGIDADFSITSDMLNIKGKKIFDKYYSVWLEQIDYSQDIDTDFFDSLL